MTSQRVQSVEEAIAAVREHVEHGVDWIKLFPGGNYSFLPNGDLNFVTTYPLPVLQALVDETHRLGSWCPPIERRQDSSRKLAIFTQI